MIRTFTTSAPVVRRRARSLADALSPYRVTRAPSVPSQRRAARALPWAVLQRKARNGR